MIAERSEIKFQCSQCGQSIAVDVAGAGLAASCPTCANPLVVPTLQSLHDRAYGQGRAAPPTRGGFADEEARELREETRLREESERALAVARKEIAESGQHAAIVEAQLTDARAVIAQLGAQLAAAEENRAQWEQAAAQATEAAAAGAAQWTAREAEICEGQAAAVGEMEMLRRETEDLREQLAGAQNALRDASVAAGEKLGAVERTLEAADADREAISSRCDAARKEADMLRHDLSELHSGRELLSLRERFLTLETDHQRATSALARLTDEWQTATAAETQLRAELAESRQRAADAEHRADAATESALKKDNEVLRGIIDRQKVVLEERFIELRRLKRARLVLHILYTLIGFSLVGLAALAISALPEAVRRGMSEWFGW